jgi:glycosyltransferase involved in cell wall biosynthesis
MQQITPPIPRTTTPIHQSESDKPISVSPYVNSKAVSEVSSLKTDEHVNRTEVSYDNTEVFFISIVAPVYNVGQYLRECLDSVLAQTYTKWELILVDDGSTDDSGKICEEYAACDSRITVIHQKNSGVAVARNVGLKAAHGTYIYLVDPDDKLLSSSLAILAKITLDNNLPDVIKGNYYDYRLDGTMVVNPHSPKKEHYSKMLMTIQDFVTNVHGMPCFVWNTMYRRDFLFKNDICFPKGLNIGEDGIFVYTYGLYSGVAIYTNDLSYIYRIRHVSLSSKMGFRYVNDTLASLPIFYKIWESHTDVGVKSLLAWEIGMKNNTILRALCRISNQDFARLYTEYNNVIKHYGILKRTGDKIVAVYKVSPLCYKLLSRIIYRILPNYRRIQSIN